MAQKQICSICEGSYTGYGNNAWPVNKGRCCDFCNGMTVIPARLTLMFSQEGRAPKETGEEKPHA